MTMKSAKREWRKSKFGKSLREWIRFQREAGGRHFSKKAGKIAGIA
jgi:hypothetical protein